MPKKVPIFFFKRAVALRVSFQMHAASGLLSLAPGSSDPKEDQPALIERIHVERSKLSLDECVVHFQYAATVWLLLL